MKEPERSYSICTYKTGRNLILAATVVLAGVSAFALCGCKGEDKSVAVGAEVVHTQETQTQETTQTQTEPTTKDYSNIPGFLGLTSKGYVIKEIDGVTYVDDILIANKTYGLPETYEVHGLDATVENAFDEMNKDAKKEDLNLYISSGYRSYTLQKKIYNNYVSSDGKEKADTYSARPGHSEHQTGLCFDLNTIEDSFAETEEGKWVADNCYKYGFVIRYPKGKQEITGYKYESWHLRYLGKELALQLHESGLCLEEYLGITSEYAED